jgi:hypothetical protein
VGPFDSFGWIPSSREKITVTDPNLLIFGCIVSSIACSGAYVYIREVFTGEEDAEVPVEVRAPSPSTSPPVERDADRLASWRVEMRLWKGYALALAVAALGASSAGAAEIEGVSFAERLERDDAVLELQGVGLLRYRLVFKGYVAGLYLGVGVKPEAVLDDAPRRLEIEYFWAIPAEKFAWSTTEGVARNVDPETFESLRARIEQFNEFYDDVEPGDRYALTYVPGVGTELALNGEPRGLVPGSDFSSALFAIWFGDAPLDASLKRKLLATP